MPAVKVQAARSIHIRGLIGLLSLLGLPSESAVMSMRIQEEEEKCVVVLNSSRKILLRFWKDEGTCFF